VADAADQAEKQQNDDRRTTIAQMTAAARRLVRCHDGISARVPWKSGVGVFSRSIV
jgi:hypothetical protein